MVEERRRISPLEAEAAGRRALLRILRVGLVALMIGVTTLWGLQVGQDPWWLAIPFAIALSVAVIAIDALTPRKKISTLSGVFLGLLAGLLVTIALSRLIDLLADSFSLAGRNVVTTLTDAQGRRVSTVVNQSPENPLVTTIKIIVGIAVCYLTVSIVLQTQDDFRLVIPYVEFARQHRGVRPMLVDTSVLIDGRLLDMAKAGFVQSPLIVPRCVIEELQTLADSQDRAKRTRGRRGLDMLARLQRAPADVSIDDAQPLIEGSVDQSLVEMAKREGSMIVTTDSGLARVATVNGVTALNLHELATALRPSVIAGETIVVRVVKPGEQPGQGVGYLDDGALVVVENGGGLIGTEASLVVTGTLQTSAGRMVFARAAEGEAAAQPALAAPAAGGAEAMVEPPAEAGDGEAGAGDTDAAAPEGGGPFPPRKPSHRRAPARNPRRS